MFYQSSIYVCFCVSYLYFLLIATFKEYYYIYMVTLLYLYQRYFIILFEYLDYIKLTIGIPFFLLFKTFAHNQEQD